MKPFAFLEPLDVAQAVRMLAENGSEARPIAGGSDLLGELKDGVAHYDRLVSLGRIVGLEQVRPGAKGDEGLWLGAGITLSRLEHEPLLTGPYRMLAEAARGVATPEIRNQGTLGGNLCQRPRCFHYRSRWISCLKKGGSDCPAQESDHQHYLAIMGGSNCHAVHASDLAPPLLALGARVHLAGVEGERSLPLADFFAGPERDVTRENILAPAELVTAVELPPLPPDWHGVYLKARERNAGDFPLVSVAFGCRMEGKLMADVRMVLGGVAPVPWPCPRVEALLEGQSPSPALAGEAARAAFAEAVPLAGNGFKLEMGRALVKRIIGQVTGLEEQA